MMGSALVALFLICYHILLICIPACFCSFFVLTNMKLFAALEKSEGS